MTTPSSASEEPSRGRFSPGDHIRVRRPVGPAGYMHHGVYVSDDRVIQFGGRVMDKPQATIGAVTLDEFERGAKAEVVERGRRIGLVPGLPPALPGEQVIERAEWLLKNYEPGLYHLVGNNCEHMANWCASGGYSESHQVRVGFSILAAISAPSLLYLSYQRRRNAPVPRWVGVVLVLLSVVGIGGKTLYDEHIRRFWRDIGSKWATERGDEPQSE